MNRKAIDRISLVIYLLSIIIFTVIFRTVRSFLVTVLISTSVLLVYLTYSKYKYTKSTRIKDYSNNVTSSSIMFNIYCHFSIA